MASPLNSSGLLQVDADTTSETFNAGFTFTAGRDAFLNVAHFASAGNTIASVAIGGTAATRDVRADGTSGDAHAEIWRAQNIAGGTASVVVTYTGGSDNYVSGSVEEYAAGVFVNPALDSGTENTATGNSTAPSATTAISTSQADTQIIGVFVTGTSVVNNGITGPTSGTQTWVEQNSSAHEGGAGGYRTESSTGSKSMTFAMTSGLWAACVAAYKLAPLGPVVDTPPQSTTVYRGQTANFTVSATTSGGTLHYQWKDDGVNVGTDSSSYTTAATVLGDNGAQITCDVTDDNGTTVSSAATLTVLQAADLAWFTA